MDGKSVRKSDFIFLFLPQGWYHREDVAHYSRMKRVADEANAACHGHRMED